MAAGILEFGEFQLDCDRFELRRNGSPLRLERQPLELLILLASSGGRLVTRDEISRLLWPSEVFVDTEHGINTAIRKIRHALRDDPEHPRFLQTVTGKGYRFVGASPKPEPSPAPGQPAQPEPPVPQPVVPTRPPALHRRLWLTASAAGLIIALLGVAIFAARKAQGHTGPPAITSIAVLPLDNLTGDPSQNYLADGMTDELTTQLARDSSLRVISRTSVMQYKGARRPLPEIARALNVDGILEGSLDRTGNQVHMTVQLIYAPTDTHLWAQSYDRNPNDLVTLPREAALTIAKATHSSTASSAPPQKYLNPAAHDAYLRGHYLWFSSNEGASGQFFLKATQLQPDYAPGWAGLANYYAAQMIEGDLDPRINIPLEKQAALKAVQLDDSLPEAHLAMAASHWVIDRDFDAAFAELDRALQLDPKFTEAYHLRGKLLGELNRQDEAIAQQRIAMDIDPFERPWSLALYYIWARRFDAAIADAKQRLEAKPDPAMWGMLYLAYTGKGMDNEAEHALEQEFILTGRPTLAESFHRHYVHGGTREILLERLAYLKLQSQKHYVSPIKFAALYAPLGQKQQALACLDDALHQHSPALLEIQEDTSFDSLHSDPHYRAIIQKTGLPPAW